MKDAAYRAKCVEKAVGKYSNLDVMLKLADFAFDIFVISLKDENKNITQKEIRQKIKEFAEWKASTSKK